MLTKQTRGYLAQTFNKFLLSTPQNLNRNFLLNAIVIRLEMAGNLWTWLKMADENGWEMYGNGCKFRKLLKMA